MTAWVCSSCAAGKHYCDWMNTDASALCMCACPVPAPHHIRQETE